MSNINVTLSASLEYYDGSLATSVAVKAIRHADPLLAATMATADIIEGTSNASTGVISLTLVGRTDIPVTYKVVLNDGQYFYLRIPRNASACRLGVITVSQSPAIGVKDITSQITPFFLGANIASAATISPSCSVHRVTGTTTITALTATEYPIGQPLTLIFDGALTFTDGSNLKLAGNLVSTAGDTITLVSNGTDFFEIGRSVN